MGYSDPKIGLGDFPSADITSTGNSRTFFTTASLDASLTEELGLQVSFHRFQQKFDLLNNALGLGISGPPGALFLDSIYDEETTEEAASSCGRTGRIPPSSARTSTAGSSIRRFMPGRFSKPSALPATSAAHPGVDRWAVYANDTIAIDRWSITPGIRYDHNSITGSFVSPSLGVTYRLGGDSILKGLRGQGLYRCLPSPGPRGGDCSSIRTRP